MITLTGIQHVLLDIEGTTCPVSFVKEVLFPYAQQQLPIFLADQAENPTVQKLINHVFDAWDQDSSPEAKALRQKCTTIDLKAAINYLDWLIEIDRKLTPLKEIQGLIWRQGYDQGILKVPLYEDVPEALARWKNAGLILSVYSSGSINAQKLLYKHSNHGDLSNLISHWFDTSIGNKQQRESYDKIANALNINPDQVVFISDRKSELNAANEAGFKVLFSQRADNPESDNGNYIEIKNYAELNLSSN